MWHSPRFPTAATEWHDQRCIADRPQTSAKTVSLGATLRRWYWTSFVRLFVAELRNLVERTRQVREIHEWGLRGCTGLCPTVWAEIPDSQCRTCKHAYISDMQAILNTHLSLTIVDSHLLSQAWWAARRSVLRMDRPQNQQRSCSLCSPVGTNSMPPLAVQQ